MPRNVRGYARVRAAKRALESAIIRCIAIGEAMDMVDRGEAIVVCSDPLEIQLVEQVRKPQPGAGRTSKATIIRTEVEANAFAKAGFRDYRSHTRNMTEAQKLQRMHRGRATEDYIERVENKIDTWPDEIDRLAVRTGPAATVSQAEQESRRQAQISAAQTFLA